MAVGFSQSLVALAVYGAVAHAQPVKVVRIGFLGPTSAVSNAGRMEALRAGLRDLGYLEGKESRHRVSLGRGKVRSPPRIGGRTGSPQR